MRAALTACLAVAGAVAPWHTFDARPLTGLVQLEGKGEAVAIRVFALGENAMARPELGGTPVAVAEVKPNVPFSIELQGTEGPVDVEVSASGHVAARFTAAAPEQTALPPLVLPVGVAAQVRVAGHGAAGTVLRGELGTVAPASPACGRWRAALPTVTVDATGQVSWWQPLGRAVLALTALAPDGRWGRAKAELPSRTATVALDSRELRVLVRTATGEPAPGIRVAGRGAPRGAAVTTAPDGRATVQVAATGPVQVVAIGSGVGAELTRALLPAAEVTLDLAPLREVPLQLVGAATVVLLDPAWLPDALSGGAPWLAHGQPPHLPWPGHGPSRLALGGPGLASVRLDVPGVEMAMAVKLRASVRVEGRVVDAAGVAVAGQIVRVFGGASDPAGAGSQMTSAGGQAMQELLLPGAVSGPDGRFVIPWVDPGPVRCSVHPAGMPPADSAQVASAPDGSTLELTITLSAGASLKAEVRDAAGRPLEGVSVRLLRADRVRGARRTLPLERRVAPPAEVLAAATTDSTGKARVSAAPLGPVTVELARSGFVTRQLETSVLPQGSDLGVVRLDPASTIDGRVIDETGKPVPDAVVGASSMRAAVLAGTDAVTDSTGGFTIAGQPPSGAIYLAARAAGMVASTPLEVAMPATGPVELRVRRGRAVEGRVVDEHTGGAIAGAQVVVTRGGRRSRMSTSAPNARLGGTTETGDDGGFRVEGLDLGEWALGVSARGYWPTIRNVTISADGAAPPLTVALATGKTLHGRVVDAQAQPVAGASVDARPVSDTNGKSPFAFADLDVTTATDGAFRVSGLAAGTVVVTASDDTGAQTSQLAEAGQEREVVLTLEEPGSLSGRVLAPDGSPIAGATVDVIGSRGVTSPGCTTGARGGFTYGMLAAGSYQVIADHEGFTRASQAVLVEPGRPAVVQLTLGPWVPPAEGSPRPGMAPTPPT